MDKTPMLNKKALVITDDLSTSVSRKANENNAVAEFLSLLKACGMQTHVSDQRANHQDFAAYDFICINAQSHGCDNPMPATVAGQVSSNTVLLFNAPDVDLCEKQALLSGIGGVFYAHNRSDIIFKGIQALLRGEHWFKRHTLELVVTELIQRIPSNAVSANTTTMLEASNTLTKREKSIVSLVSNGAQNQEIADQLHISVNTVKTHIYSIFRKTHCRNRVELIKWAQSQLLSA